MTAKECESGISYKTYLGLLLLFQEPEELAVKAMDVQEMTLSKENGCIKFDQLVVRAKATIVYEYAPVFFDFSKRIHKNPGYEIFVSTKYGYY
jgi:hypothetical protein